MPAFTRLGALATLATKIAKMRSAPWASEYGLRAPIRALSQGAFSLSRSPSLLKFATGAEQRIAGLSKNPAARKWMTPRYRYGAAMGGMAAINAARHPEDRFGAAVRGAGAGALLGLGAGQARRLRPLLSIRTPKPLKLTGSWGFDTATGARRWYRNPGV